MPSKTGFSASIRALDLSLALDQLNPPNATRDMIWINADVPDWILSHPNDFKTPGR